MAKSPPKRSTPSRPASIPKAKEVLDLLRSIPDSGSASLYLSGSILEGTATRGSDIDLILVQDSLLKEAAPSLAERITISLEDAWDLPVGILTLDREKLPPQIPAYMKAGQLVFGEDLFLKIPELSARDQGLRWSQGSLRLTRMFLEGLPRVRETLKEEGEVSVKLAYSLLCRQVGALLGLRRNYAARSKRDCAARIFEVVPEGLAMEFGWIQKAMRQDLGYRVRACPEDLDLFQEVLTRVLALAEVLTQEIGEALRELEGEGLEEVPDLEEEVVEVLGLLGEARGSGVGWLGER